MAARSLMQAAIRDDTSRVMGNAPQELQGGLLASKTLSLYP